MPSVALRNGGRLRQPMKVAALALALSACTGSIGGAGSPGKNDPPGPGGGPGGAPAGPGAGGPGSAPGNGTAPGNGGGGPATPGTPGVCAAPVRRVWKLTPDQYSRAVESVLPGVVRAGDNIAASLAEASGFSNSADALAMTGPHVTQVLKNAWQIGSDAAADPGKLLPCLPAGAKDPACLRQLVETYGTRAFRRDLAPAELDELSTFVRKQVDGGDLPGALRQLFIYLLSSPNFLYRTELGPESAGSGPITLTSFEKASALAFFLTDGPPDAELLDAARKGTLDNRAEVETQTRRLLGAPDRAHGLIKFLREALGTQAVLAARKDAVAFPGWTEALAKDLATESDSFVRHVIWSGGGKFATLLSADYSLLNQSLASHYGVAASGLGAGFQKVTFPAGQRAGFVTLAGLMAAKSNEDDTAPVRRGQFVRESLLCQKVPDPPPTVNNVPPQPDGKRTQRERLAIHSTDASCSGCHSLMDPIGLGFERYDGVGRHRTMDVGKTIDASGKISLASGEASFSDAVELMQILAKAPETAACFVDTAFRYAQGREPDLTGADRCTIDRLHAAFAASGGGVVDLAIAIATDDSFFSRQ
jgi:hypothetical protein